MTVDRPAGAETVQTGDADAADRESPPTPPSGEESERGRFTSLRTLWLNAALLGVVLLAILGIMRPTSIAAVDEGLYLAQAKALTNGSWSIERQATDVDPDGKLDPLYPEAVLGDRIVPYARHSTYPLLMTPFFWVGGYVGTLILSMIGTWGAAVATAFLARRLNHRYGLWALWLTGIGSPLLFDGFITMAHALAAAGAGIAFLGITRAVDDRRWSALIYAIPALVFTVLMRSEGVIYGLAVAVAVGAMALGLTKARQRDWAAIILAGAIGVISAGTYVIDTRIDQAITGVDAYGVNAVRIAGRASANPVSGSWASLFRPFEGTWVNAGIAVPLGALAIILAALSLRLVPKRTLLPMGFCLGAAAAGIVALINPPGLVTGLFAAFPVLVAGLIWIRRADLGSTLVPGVLIVTALTTAGVVATIHGSGGATEWGGRLFHILLPILIPLVVLGLDHARLKVSYPEAIVALVCLVVFTASMSVSGLRYQVSARDFSEALVTETAEYMNSRPQEAPRLVLSGQFGGDGSTRLFWDTRNEFELLTAFSIRSLGAVSETARDAGRSGVVIVTNIDAELFETVFDNILDDLGWEILDTYSTARFTFVTIGEPAT